MTKSKTLSLTTAALLGACATAQPLNTPSGKPEVFIQGKTQQQVVEAVVDSCARAGAMIDNQSTSTVTCSKMITDIMGQLAFSGSNGSAQHKTQLVITPEHNGHKVVITNQWVESISGFGGVTRQQIPIAGKNAKDNQAGLNAMASRLMGQGQ